MAVATRVESTAAAESSAEAVAGSCRDRILAEPRPAVGKVVSVLTLRGRLVIRVRRRALPTVVALAIVEIVLAVPA